jgi:pyruvate ferredoxin oxidoreductase gamma subunit
MKEIIMWGRGGQGAVIASEMLAGAFAKEGKWVSAFPSFGPERRGAPVDAFIRFNEKKITTVSQIRHPDCLIVMDRMRANTTPEDPEMREGGILVLNISNDFIPAQFKGIDILGRIDATSIALEEIGRDISNSVMLGAFARATGWVGLDSLVSVLEEKFQEKLLKQNVRCMERGYEEIDLIKSGG